MACPSGEDQCRAGFVWREAMAGDHVCVTGSVRAQAAADNRMALARRNPPGLPNPDQCLPGFVWREATGTDRVCVSGATRAQAWADNRQAAARRDPACANHIPVRPDPGAPPPAAQSPTSNTTPTATLGGYLITVSGMTSLAPLTEGSATALCPSGKVVSGGWAYVEGQVVQSRPVPDGSGYLVLGYQGDLIPVGTPGVSAHAICVDRPSGYEIVVARRNLASGERGVVQASCPAGKILLGGGAGANRQAYLAGSAPSADGTAWEALFRSLWIVPSNETVQAYAVCADAATTPDRRLAAGPSTLLGPGGITEQELSCAPQKPLALGWAADASIAKQGWVSMITPQTVLNRPRPLYLMSGATGNGAGAFDNNPSLQVTLRAICVGMP